MAFTSGTATDYADLLDKLRLYLVAQGWTQLAWTAGTVAGGGASLAVRGPGAGAGLETFIQIRTESNVSLSYYGWRIRGSIGWDVANPEGSQPGQQPTPSYFNLWQNSIDYRFYVNDRRFIVVAKLGTVTLSMYAGFFLPWSLPTGYPFPLYIAGTYFELNIYNLANSAHRFFCDPGGLPYSLSTAWVRNPSGNWIPMVNHTPTGANDNNHSFGNSYTYGAVHPYGVGGDDDNITDAQYLYGGTGLLEYMVRTRQDEIGMWPISLHGVQGVEEAYGVLDGAYCIPGIGLVNEQTFTASARNFRVFQNVGRSSGNDFVAIEEV